MRDRYSLIVGLLFAIVVLIAVLHRGKRRRLDPRPRPGTAPLALAAVRGAARDEQARRRRERRPGRLRNLGTSLPRPTRAARRPAASREPGAFRVC